MRLRLWWNDNHGSILSDQPLLRASTVLRYSERMSNNKHKDLQYIVVNKVQQQAELLIGVLKKHITVQQKLFEQQTNITTVLSP